MHLFYILLRLILIGSLSFSQFEREGFEGFGRKKGERERERKRCIFQVKFQMC